MTHRDGSPDDMRLLSALRRRLFLDEGTAERLVSGAISPDDAPPAYADVARVLADASAPAQPHETEGEAAAVAMFVAERDRAVDAEDRQTSGRSLRYSMRTATVAVVGALLLTGGVAAAATGHLPDPVQGAAHDTLGHLGVSIPAPSDRSNQVNDVKSTESDPTASGDDDRSDPTGSADGSSSDPAGSGDADGSDPTASGGQQNGMTVCAQASDGQCLNGQHGADAAGNPSDNGANPSNGQGPPAIPPGHASTTIPGTTTTTTHPGNGPPASNPGRSGASSSKGSSGKS